MVRISRRTAFTLVEILIVVVILAILAAAVIPQFTDSTKDAKTSTALYNLSTLRSQLAIYKAQHNGTNPALANVVTQLTTATTATGAAGGTLGPYLQVIPDNPLVTTNMNTIVAPAAVPPVAVVANAGWLYDVGTGNFWVNDLTNINK